MTNRELLDATQLSQVLATTRRDLFRMETLPSYDVPINRNDFERWMEGEAEPTWENKRPWMDTPDQMGSGGTATTQGPHHPRSDHGLRALCLRLGLPAQRASR